MNFDDTLSHFETTPDSERKQDRQTHRRTDGETDNLRQHSVTR